MKDMHHQQSQSLKMRLLFEGTNGDHQILEQFTDQVLFHRGVVGVVVAGGCILVEMWLFRQFLISRRKLLNFDESLINNELLT
jgi:hypothetical protein